MSLRERLFLFLQLCEQPDILDRDHRLIGEGLEQGDLLVGEWSGRGAPHGDRPGRDTIAQHWDREATSPADRPGERWMPVLPVELDIGRVDYTALKDSASHNRCPAGRGWKYAMCDIKGRGRKVVCRDEVEQLTIETGEGAEDSIAQPRSAFDDGIEDRLDVGLRLADDTQDLARGRLLPQRLLRLVEQAHVLDGNDRLVGEGLEQSNLTVREETRFGATNHNRTDCEAVLSHQRHAENRAVSQAARDFAPLRKLVRLGLDVGNVDGASVQNRSPGGPASNQRLHRCSRNRTLVSH